MARDLDGSLDYLDVTSDSGITLSGDVTVALWFHADTLPIGGYRTLWGKTTGGGLGECDAFIQSPTQVYYRLGGDGGTTVSTTGTWSTGAWTHFVMRRSGSTVTFWRNGSQVGSTTNSNTTTGSNVLRIGRDPAGGGTDWDGRLAEFALWQSTALADAQIAALAKGYTAPHVRRSGLKLYLPIMGIDSPERDVIGGRTASVNGSCARAAHPRLYRRRGARVVPDSGGGGGGGPTFKAAWARGSTLVAGFAGVPAHA